MSNILQRDKDFVWHPFTYLKHAEEPINIIKSEGAYYFDDKGNKIIDAISSWWVNLHGHSHPYIAKKISEQLNTNAHSIFSGFTHQGAVDLAERLLKHLPQNQSKIFYSDNGSTAVEVGLKMCLQYWHNQGVNKTTFIAFEGAYHGDTFGGMSVGARNAFNNAFSPLLFNVVHIPLPNQNNIELVKSKLTSVLKEESCAGFIYEPLVQGAAGMRIYDAEHLEILIQICKENNCLCIADEVMTGFGRTGKFFASDYIQIQPDIICLSKGITGGFMPLGVTSCTSSIYCAFISDDKMKTFFHGHSYTANPTACAAALASMDLMEEKSTWKNIERINISHLDFMKSIVNESNINSICVLGTILSIELKTSEQTGYLNSLAEKIPSYFIKKGILIRPLGNIIYLIPPYCISDLDLGYIYSSIKMFIEENK